MTDPSWVRRPRRGLSGSRAGKAARPSDGASAPQESGSARASAAPSDAEQPSAAVELYTARQGRQKGLRRRLAENRFRSRFTGDTSYRKGSGWPWPHGDPAFAPGFRRADTTISERKASRKRKVFGLPPSLLRAAFPPDEFGLGANCTDAQLSEAVDQSWLAARGYVISGAAGLPGNTDADACTAPQSLSVAIPGPIAPEDAAAFWAAFEEAAFQLPEQHTQLHLDACADQAWNECFAPPVALSERDQAWATVPAWCWVDESFCEAFATVFEALPDTCTNDELAAALEAAWEESQGDNWQ